MRRAIGFLGALAGTTIATGVAGAQGSVIETVHNLSVTGPGEIRALSESEVCKFCHIPHSALAPEPLWGHAMPGDPGYRVPRGNAVIVPPPEGGSLLCLSCHDGTVALGNIAGEREPVALRQQFFGADDSGYLGIDLSGHHPISFVMPESDAFVDDLSRDMGLRPLAAVRTDPDVRLDANGRMQCSTCHDAHADVYYQPGTVPRFWVKPTVGDVCIVCHDLR